MNQRAQAVVASQTEARHAPTAEIPKPNLAAFVDNPREREPAGVGGSQDTADAATGDAGDGYVFFLKNLQDPQVRIATSETASESQADSGAEVWVVYEVGDEVSAARHEGRVAKRRSRTDGTGVPSRQYEGTARKRREISVQKARTVRKY